MTKAGNCFSFKNFNRFQGLLFRFPIILPKQITFLMLFQTCENESPNRPLKFEFWIYVIDEQTETQTSGSCNRRLTCKPNSCVNFCYTWNGSRAVIWNRVHGISFILMYLFVRIYASSNLGIVKWIFDFQLLSWIAVFFSRQSLLKISFFHDDFSTNYY